MLKNKILTTGGSGFLGRILTDRLRENGYEVKDLSDLHNGRVDISKKFMLDADYVPDVVIHMAGKAHSIPNNQDEERRFLDINFQGTINLCEALERLPIIPEAFIFISSVSVYGKERGVQITEDTSLLGNTPYAKSKILAENYLIDWAKSNKIVLGILRLPLVVGKNPPGNLGAMIRGIETGKYLSIGKADAKKSMVWAEDISLILPKLTEIGGIYNLTDNIHPTFGQLERTISECLGKKKPKRIPYVLAKLLANLGDLLGTKFPIDSSKLEKIVSSLTFSDDKAKEKLDWRPSSVLDKLRQIL